ncbi:MAG: hypothetical protein NTZ80_01900 [Patescibacteria group bacterium]|nr:hypothetical protein [Patescibacteria group bacterium]
MRLSGNAKITIIFVAILALIIPGQYAQADFWDSFKGKTLSTGKGFHVNIDVTGGDNPVTKTNGPKTINFPKKDEGLLTWGYRAISVFRDEAMRQTALEMAIPADRLNKFKEYLLSVATEPKSMLELDAKELEARRAYQRNLDGFAMELEAQIRELATATLANGIYGDGSDYDIIYEIMKIEAEWVGAKRVNKKRINITPQFDDQGQCSGFFCYFIKFEKEKAPAYKEDENSIIAHLQWLAETIYQAAQGTKMCFKRTSLMFQPAAAAFCNRFEPRKSISFQFEAVPMHNGEWVDYAGALGGVWNSIAGFATKNTSGKADAKLKEQALEILDTCLGRSVQTRDEVIACANRIIDTEFKQEKEKSMSFVSMFKVIRNLVGTKIPDPARSEWAERLRGSVVDTLNVALERNLLSEAMQVVAQTDSVTSMLGLQDNANELGKMLSEDETATKSALASFPGLDAQVTQSAQLQKELESLSGFIKSNMEMFQNIQGKLDEWRKTPKAG